jgi:hypothetical protein
VAGSNVPDDLIPVPETAVAGESVTAPKDAPGSEATPTSVATIRYGHGGENTKLNRIRARPDKIAGPTATDLAREEARLHNIAAVEAALAAQAAAAAAPKDNAAPAPVKKKRRSFACAVFKKCDPEKDGTEAQPADNTAQPAEPASNPAGGGG